MPPSRVPELPPAPRSLRSHKGSGVATASSCQQIPMGPEVPPPAPPLMCPGPVMLSVARAAIRSPPRERAATGLSHAVRTSRSETPLASQQVPSPPASLLGEEERLFMAARPGLPTWLFPGAAALGGGWWPEGGWAARAAGMCQECCGSAWPGGRVQPHAQPPLPELSLPGPHKCPPGGGWGPAATVKDRPGPRGPQLLERQGWGARQGQGLLIPGRCLLYTWFSVPGRMRLEE